MTHETWFCSDHHLGHSNIIKFEGPNGDPARTIFKSIEEHDEHIIERHNSVVRPCDKVYIIGDLGWNSSSIKSIKRMNGNKILIMGNHDRQKTKSYLNCVGELRGAVYINKPINAILTHIPVHPAQLEHRFKYSIHGHLHCHKINDPRYLNVSMEQINYTPINLEEVIQRLKNQEDEFNQYLENRIFP